MTPDFARATLHPAAYRRELLLLDQQIAARRQRAEQEKRARVELWRWLERLRFQRHLSRWLLLAERAGRARLERDHQSTRRKKIHDRVFHPAPFPCELLPDAQK
jgi:hypothetical protein